MGTNYYTSSNTIYIYQSKRGLYCFGVNLPKNCTLVKQLQVKNAVKALRNLAYQFADKLHESEDGYELNQSDLEEIQGE